MCWICLFCTFPLLFVVILIENKFMQPHYERVSRLFNGPDAVHPGIILMTRVDCALKVFMLPHFLITFFAGCHIFYVGVMGITFLIFSFYGRCWCLFPLLRMTTEFYGGHNHRNPINNTNVVLVFYCFLLHVGIDFIH